MAFIQKPVDRDIHLYQVAVIFHRPMQRAAISATVALFSDKSYYLSLFQNVLVRSRSRRTIISTAGVAALR
jgi:hypothetical protein